MGEWLEQKLKEDPDYMKRIGRKGGKKSAITRSTDYVALGRQGGKASKGGGRPKALTDEAKRDNVSITRKAEDDGSAI